jgi:tetratricopeptide (TPR) repeat protein
MGIIFGSVEQEFRGIIDMLISEGKARLLSSPNIVTLEGKEAKIDVGDKHPYRVAKYVEGGWVETIEFVTVGAKLVVTPHVKEEKNVVLDIHPEVSELTGAPPFTGAPPIVGTRETESRIAVENGKTIVVGGLLREAEHQTKEGIPLLSRLPIIGSLFRRKEIKTEKTDLLVFITPNIFPEKLEEEDVVEKRKPLSVQIEEIYQKGLDYKKAGEYEKAKGSFEEVIKKSRIYGFSDYLRYAEKELVKVERLEKERLKKEKEEKEKLEKERLEKQRLERKALVKEIYQKGLDYKKAGEYEKAKGSFEEVIKKSRIYGFSDYLRYGERQLARVERLEKQRLKKEEREKAKLGKERLEKEKPEKETILTVGPGGWFPSRDNDSFMIYEAQLRLKGNLRFFAGGGESSDEPSYIGYFGVRTGDKLNVGVGGMNSSALEKTELMFIGGFSLGGDRVRLEGNYLWVPENEDANGIKAILGIRF